MNMRYLHYIKEGFYEYENYTFLIVLKNLHLSCVFYII